MQIISIDDPKLIESTINILNAGGIVIYPTETCYGAGVNATNSKAIDRILEYKKRPEGKSISIAVSDFNMAEKYVQINETAKNLYTNFLPGPLTIISKSKGKLDKRLESENKNLGIRIPNYKILLDIIKTFGKPITSTSANSAGKKTPYSVDDILSNLSEKQKSLIDLIIDAGELPHNAPSTVIDTTTEELAVYRSGRIDPREFTNIESRITNNEGETIAFANELMNKLTNKHPKQLTMLLNGELGAGKTHFVKGIAKTLGINQIVKSPTYNYVNEYKIETLVPSLESRVSKLVHFDAWRIQSKEDLGALGFYKWFEESNIIVVEWPTVISNLDSDFIERLESYYYIDFIKLSEEKRQIRVYQKLSS